LPVLYRHKNLQFSVLRMPSTVVLFTSIASFIGAIINALVMFVILSRGRRKYHLLFALLLFTAVCWDLSIFLVMIRNSYPDEIVLYQNILSVPFSLFPAFVYHFTTNYLNQSRKRSTIALYAYCVGAFVLFVTGSLQSYSGVYNYSWGTIGRYHPIYNSGLGLIGGALANSMNWYLVYYLSISISCWLLLKARKVEASPVTRRHIGYIFVSFIVFGVALVKALVVFGVDVPFILPLGILFVDLFGAVIGMAILKHQLFDITVLVRKGIIYSVLATLVIGVFDFSQHLIASFLGSIVGEHSTYVYFASVAVVIVTFVPLKQRLDHIIGGILAKKKFEF